ncbi:unnamed protein product [Caenorhabditis angaria]|uniref:Peptidase M16 N-terminal domain-containing protein n=1 Tax=Caenorhabditis angaria TaxID=860376 RepID=A0A9P1IJ36_9PELO|nr:unnamed protein product [Caenorhabditis angaria]
MKTSIVTRSAAATKAHASKNLSTKLSNGLQVISKERSGAVSQLVLAFRAGSRYQSDKQSGLVHHIRNFVGRDTSKYPGISVVWSSAAIGANLTSFSTRDVFGVQMTVNRDHTDTALSILGHVASQPAFKAWEFEDVIPSVKSDLAFKNSYDYVLEGIHSAAFRQGSLANSIYAKRGEIGIYKSDDLNGFASKHFVSGNGVIVGINTNSQSLQHYADELLPINDGSNVVLSESPYKGGDFRRSGKGNDAHIILAGNGAAINDTNALAVQAVFLSHIGRVSPLKFATLPGLSSGLSKLPFGVAGSAFHASYEQAGLVGVYLLANGENANAAVKSAFNILKSPKIEDLEGSKRRAIAEIETNYADGANEAIQRAIIALGKGPGRNALIESIKKVSASDITQFAQKAFAKPSLASYGAISQIPYVDEL